MRKAAGAEARILNGPNQDLKGLLHPVMVYIFSEHGPNHLAEGWIFAEANTKF
jgi:hypothetical protein